MLRRPPKRLPEIWWDVILGSDGPAAEEDIQKVDVVFRAIDVTFRQEIDICRFLLRCRRHPGQGRVELLGAVPTGNESYGTNLSAMFRVTPVSAP